MEMGQQLDQPAIAQRISSDGREQTEIKHKVLWVRNPRQPERNGTCMIFRRFWEVPHYRPIGPSALVLRNDLIRSGEISETMVNKALRTG